MADSQDLSNQWLPPDGQAFASAIMTPPQSGIHAASATDQNRC
jgi:hypothetical protein